jgi:hypothetical protein
LDLALDGLSDDFLPPPGDSAFFAALGTHTDRDARQRCAIEIHNDRLDLERLTAGHERAL